MQEQKVCVSIDVVYHKLVWKGIDGPGREREIEGVSEPVWEGEGVTPREGGR